MMMLRTTAYKAPGLSSHLKLLLLGSLTAAQALHLEEVGAADVRHDASLAARLFILLSDDWTSGTILCLRRETEEANAFVTVACTACSESLFVNVVTG